MLYDALLTEQEKALRDEVRRFVRDEVPADLLRAMDREEITFPHEFIAKLAKIKAKAADAGAREQRERDERGAPHGSGYLSPRTSNMS